MITSQEMFKQIRTIVTDESLEVESSSDDIVNLAFETGRAAGKLELAKAIWLDWFGEELL